MAVIAQGKITNAIDGLELQASLFEALDSYKNDPNYSPLGLDLRPDILGHELQNIDTKALSEVLLAMDEWSNPTFWDRPDIVSKRIANGEQFGFINEAGDVLPDASPDTRGDEYKLVMSGAPWYQFQAIKNLILSERPQTLFYLGENVREESKGEQSIKILLDQLQQSDVSPNTANAARRALSILATTESVSLDDLPASVQSGIRPQIIHFRLAQGAEVPKEFSPRDRHVISLLKLHPTKLDDEFYRSIAADNAKLTEAYTALRQRLHAADSSIEERVQLFDKYLSLNDALITLLPKKGDRQLELDLMFLLSNPDIYLEVAQSAGMANILGGHATAKAIRALAKSDYYHSAAQEFLVVAGTKAPDGTPYRIELLEGLASGDLDIDAACSIAEKLYDVRVAQQLRKDVEALQRGETDLIGGEISLFQLGNVNRGILEAVPLKVFHPQEKQIIDDSLRSILDLLENPKYPEMQREFSKKANGEVESLRKYISRVPEKRIRNWAKKFLGEDYSESASVDIYKRAWCIAQLSLRCIEGEVRFDKKLKDAIARCIVLDSTNLFVNGQLHISGAPGEQARLLSNIIGILRKREAEPLEKLFLSNLKAAGGTPSLTAAEVLNSFSSHSQIAAELNHIFQNSELKFYIPNLGFRSPNSIHKTASGTFAEVFAGDQDKIVEALEFLFLYKLDALDEPPHILPYKFRCEWVKGSEKQTYAKVCVRGSHSDGYLYDLNRREYIQIERPEARLFTPLDINLVDPGLRFFPVETKTFKGGFYSNGILDVESKELVHIDGVEVHDANSGSVRLDDGHSVFTIGYLDKRLAIINLDSKKAVTIGDIRTILNNKIYVSEDELAAYAAVQIGEEWQVIDVSTGDVIYRLKGDLTIKSFFFGGEELRTPIGIIGNSDSSQMINFQTGEVFDIPSIGRQYFENEEKLQPSSSRYVFLKSYSDGAIDPDSVIHLFDLKKLKEVEDFPGRVTSILNVVETKDKKYLYFRVTGPAFGHSSNFMRLNEEGKLDIQFTNDSFLSQHYTGAGLSMSKKVADALNSNYETVTSVNFELTSRRLYIVGKPSNPFQKNWNVANIDYNLDSGFGLSVSTERDFNNIYSVFPVPNSNSVYALGTRKEGLKGRTAHVFKEVNEGTGKEIATKFFDNCDPIFSPDGKSRFLVVQHNDVKVGTYFKIYDLMTGKVIPPNGGKIGKIYKPIIAEDGRSCFLQYEEKDDTVWLVGYVPPKRNIIALWWKEEGFPEYTSEEIQEMCQPKYIRDVDYS